MVKIYSFLFFLLITIPLFSQKVTVGISKSSYAAGTDWQILDSQFLPVVAGSDFPGLDSVSVALEEHKRYYLQVSVPNASTSDNWLYRLYINSEAVLLVRSDQPAGDHFYSFVTGVREPVAKISGGTAADIANYPWQVYLVAANYSCGGSIIAGNWIITAAHCTEDESGNLISASKMYVVVGANNPRTGDGKTYYVSKVIRHENYNSQTLENDIALLQLSSTISYTNATPIRLISKIDSAAGATDPGVMSWVTGYGLIKANPATYPVVLQKVQLPIVSNTEAATVWDDIAKTDLMAGYRSGNKDACNGDSGGPLIVPVDDGYKLAGLVSWGSSNCDTYGAYTRVSIFEKWISSNTGIEVSYVPPVPTGDSIICPGTTESTYSIPVADGTTAYEWVLLPTEAGSVSANASQATVSWTQGYTGAAYLKLRVTRYGFDSYWSYLTIHLAKSNNLLGQSEDTVICAGKPVTLVVSSEGYNLNYSWYKNGTLVTSGSSASLLLSNTTVSSTATYRCDIAGSCGNPLSTQIGLTVLPVTAIQNLSPDTEAAFGDNVNLDVTSDGHDLIYQWFKDGNMISDAVAPQYVMTDVNASNTGLYRVDISGTCGDVQSSNIYLYVTDANDDAGKEVSVWPTVSGTEFNVALSTDDTYNISLFTVAGERMKDLRNCQFKTTVSASGLATGVYLMEVYGTGFRKTIKVIKI
jgi:secreted trypsin-like serine protease